METVIFRRIALMVMMMTSMMVNMAKSELHYVGGNKFSWAPNVNLTQWSMHQHFYVHDWLYFGYDRHMQNVLEVNKTSYENCIDKDFIKNITRGGGKDVIELKEVKTYYFLSSGGFCWNGLKVVINVENVAPTPSPGHNKSSSCTIGINQNLVILLILMWGIIIFK
ncbi:early nodulin-like protein 20 [Arachis stenosperma]|uniref:early nodulin-like protein 20 n=1 Tax=Arachis stenosperma TaxID=217475 RepID=UPI0025ACF2A5|nr:early nodulin-like protein 20 [Arachis stenosperma]